MISVFSQSQSVSASPASCQQIMKWSPSKLSVFWNNGGNWLVFFITWFVTSAIMVSLEQSDNNIETTEEVMNQQQIKLIVNLLTDQKEHLKDNQDLESQMEKIIELLETNADIPRLYGKMNIELALVKHDMMKVIIGLFRDEFIRIKTELNEDDSEGVEAASKLIELFSDSKTVEAFSRSGKAEVAQYLTAWNASDYECEVSLMIFQC